MESDVKWFLRVLSVLLVVAFAGVIYAVWAHSGHIHNLGFLSVITYLALFSAAVFCVFRVVKETWSIK